MCTCAEYKTKDTYFGRNLDYEFSYGEEVVVMPRKFVINLAHEGEL
ncbi:MAG: linear amide C-N hydrolase [Erysipelotrichaceae bacterium]|nr:linear amide C-N hydrolase [Erysipelotrichaceae bacterium]